MRHRDLASDEVADARRFLRVRDVAAELGLPRSTVHSWITARLLPHYRFGGPGSIVLIARDDLAEFLARHRVEPAPRQTRATRASRSASGEGR